MKSDRLLGEGDQEAMRKSSFGESEVVGILQGRRSRRVRVRAALQARQQPGDLLGLKEQLRRRDVSDSTRMGELEA